MNSIYPTNLPGFVYYHDPTKLDYKKSSMAFQDKKNHGEIEAQKSYSLPNTKCKDPNSTLNQNFEEIKEYLYYVWRKGGKLLVIYLCFTNNF